jgi:hypothetical protein
MQELCKKYVCFQNALGVVTMFMILDLSLFLHKLKNNSCGCSTQKQKWLCSGVTDKIQ